MRATVTGADGFVGQWLLRRLLRDEAEITGVIRSPNPSLVTLDVALAGRVAWNACDVRDLDSLRSLMRVARPDVIFHLAAQSFVPASNQDPLTTFETNVMGTVNVLEASRAEAPEARVLVVGTSDAYGAVTPEQLPLRESTTLSPRNPYAASKAAAECVTLQYAHAGWSCAIATRSFNHTGPGQNPIFAIASFAKQIAAIKAKRQQPHLSVGDLTPRRDISDVRDVVEAYILLAQRGTVGAVYNVCGGTDWSMREIVDKLLGISGVQAEIREDPALARPVDTPVLRGDPSRIEQDTGWKARTSIDRTLADMFEYYARVAA